MAIGELLSDGQVLLAGNVRAEGQRRATPQRYYNSVVAINDQGEIIDAVDKLHLVPGGEYLPFVGPVPAIRHRPDRRHADAVFGRERCAIRSPSPTACGAAIFVCYEIIFPDEVADRRQGRRLHRQRDQRRLVRRHAGTLPAFPQRPDPRGRDRPAAAARRQQRHFGRHRFAWAGHRRLALNVRGEMDVSLDIPTPSPPPLGDPRVNGYLILALLALVGVSC